MLFDCPDGFSVSPVDAERYVHRTGLIEILVNEDVNASGLEWTSVRWGLYVREMRQCATRDQVLSAVEEAKISVKDELVGLLRML